MKEPTMRAIYIDKDIPKALLVKAFKPIWPGIVFTPLSPSRYEDMPEPGVAWAPLGARPE
jgi:hypothetical protein